MNPMKVWISLPIWTEEGGMSRISRRNFVVGATSLAATGLAFGEVFSPDQRAYPGTWKSAPPMGCPFTSSDVYDGLYFTGRHQQYADADTWYPSWADDGIQYSPFADGTVLNSKGQKVSASCGAGFESNTGYARIMGDDPMNLKIVALGTRQASGMPYGGRYPCANLVHNGIWYYGTYCCDINLRVINGVAYNWAWLGPFMGCRYSKDFGRTWVDSPCRPWAPLFPQSVGGEKVQIHKLQFQKKDTLGDKPGTDVRALIPGLPLPQLGVMHFVDFGKNMKHSPDGKAYLVGHGNAPDTLNPRLGAVSWLSGNAIYLIRVSISPETVNDPSHYEYFAGYDNKSEPIWTRRHSDMKPMLEWVNHLGSVTITYNQAIEKYLMCIADGWPSTRMINTILMESDNVAGPWRMICYLRDFGVQGYFVNIPSKFIAADGDTFWFCYSANFTNGWLHTRYRADPPGSRYGLCLQEVRLSRKGRLWKATEGRAVF